MKKIKTNALRQGPISLKVLARMKKIIDSKVRAASNIAGRLGHEDVWTATDNDRYGRG
jgi:hypothetical protein